MNALNIRGHFISTVPLRLKCKKSLCMCFAFALLISPLTPCELFWCLRLVVAYLSCVLPHCDWVKFLNTRLALLMC